MRPSGAILILIATTACQFRPSSLAERDAAEPPPPPDAEIPPPDARPVDAGCLDPAGLCAWERRRWITIDNTLLTEDLVDFPALVVLNSTRIDYVVSSPTGADLRFIDDDGVTPLAHELDTWTTSGLSLVWVKVPLVAAAPASEGFWMYYGNSSAADTQAPSVVWSNGYRAVYHFRPLSPTIDSTGNGFNGVNTGAYASTGFLGSGIAFNGVSHHIDTLLAEPLGQFTVELFANAGSFAGGPNGPFMYENNFQIVWQSPDPTQYATIGLRQGGVWHSASFMPVNGSTWTWLVGTYDGDTLRAYRDGAMVSMNSAPSGNPDAQPILGLTAKLGRQASSSAPTSYFGGAIDEARISNVARSAEWIATQDRSMRDLLLAFGPEQQL